MKKILLLAIGFFGVQSSIIAQEAPASDSIRKPKGHFYAAFGTTVNGDYNINSKLQAAGIRQIDGAVPEFTAGINLAWEKFTGDFEVTGNYLDKKNSTDRVRTAGAGMNLRAHYVPVRTKSFYLSGGLDVSYSGNQVDIFTRGNIIDLNDLDPSTHTGHISLRNELFYAGPSMAFGLFQKSDFPIRLNFGYQWAFTNGKWKSDFANVANTVKENGHDRFYVKLAFWL